MDIYEAAQLLGVAAHEISAVEQGPEGWVAVHEDMASHVTTRRLVPGTAPELGAESAEDQPVAEDGAVAPAPRKRAAKKAAGDDAAAA